MSQADPSWLMLRLILAFRQAATLTDSIQTLKLYKIPIHSNVTTITARHTHRTGCVSAMTTEPVFFAADVCFPSTIPSCVSYLIIALLHKHSDTHTHTQSHMGNELIYKHEKQYGGEPSHRMGLAVVARLDPFHRSLS